MLRPMIEAAGYRVVSEADEIEPDLIVVADGTKVDKKVASRTIRLRSDPEVASDKDNSIYRYDRAGLLMALKSAGSGRGR